jgi:hypothetical protein
LGARSWFDLLGLVLTLVIAATMIVIIGATKRWPLRRVVAAALRSRTLWLRARALALLVLVTAFAILMVINNR